MVSNVPSELFALSISAQANSKRWFGDSEVSQGLPHMVLSLCGEAGELANIVKKVERGSLDANDAHVRFDLAMELADTFVYMLNIAAILRIDLLVAYNQKCIQNEKRFVEEREKREQEPKQTGWHSV